MFEKCTGTIFFAMTIFSVTKCTVNRMVGKPTDISSCRLVGGLDTNNTCDNGGEGGIRTHGAVTHDGFQDRFLKPLGHHPVMERLTNMYDLSTYLIWFSHVDHYTI